MDKKLLLVLNGFEHLAQPQKEELIKIIQSYSVKRKLDEGIQKELKMIMGPLPVTCPCCGR